jgi:hypothetical protein
MAIERCRDRQSTAAVMPLTLSSPFGWLVSTAEGFRAARPGRGFSYRSTRAAGNNTAARTSGSPGAPSPGTNSKRCSVPRVHGATVRALAAGEYV